MTGTHYWEPYSPLIRYTTTALEKLSEDVVPLCVGMEVVSDSPFLVYLEGGADFDDGELYGGWDWREQPADRNQDLFLAYMNFEYLGCRCYITTREVLQLLSDTDKQDELEKFWGSFAGALFHDPLFTSDPDMGPDELPTLEDTPVGSVDEGELAAFKERTTTLVRTWEEYSEAARAFSN